MPNYSNSKIYKIVCKTTGLTYYGSTTATLKSRLRDHTYYKKGNRDCSSQPIIDGNNSEIVLVEDYPCETKEELLWRERYYIENNECVNIQIPIVPIRETMDKRNTYKRAWNKTRRLELRSYQNTWCGGYDYNGHNNLLRINVNIFTIDRF